MKEQTSIKNLKTIKNFALDNGFTTSYIYKLIRDQKIKSVVIDGVQFIDIVEFPSFPIKK